MLNKIRTSIRIKSSKLDGELSDLIEAAKDDLRLSGITKLDEDDHLILRAVTLYCKAHFGLDNKDSERYQKSYESLKISLSLAGDYHV